MRWAHISFAMLSCGALVACDKPADLSSEAQKIEARAPCPDANEIKAEIDALDAADQSARAAIVQRIREKLSSVRGVGFDREVADGVIVMKPGCGNLSYPDIRLFSQREFMQLLGE